MRIPYRSSGNLRTVGRDLAGGSAAACESSERTPPRGQTEVNVDQAVRSAEACSHGGSPPEAWRLTATVMQETAPRAADILVRDALSKKMLEAAPIMLQT